MVGYSWAEVDYPTLSFAQQMTLLPSNKDLFPRSIAADPASRYPLDDWTPQVFLF